MKKVLIAIYSLLYISSISMFCEAAGTAVARRPYRLRPRYAVPRGRVGTITINRLSKVEADSGRYVSQVVFEFARHVHFKVKETVKGEQIKLYFPGMKLADFDNLGVKKKLKPLVKNITIKNEKSDEVLLPSPTITMQFTKNKNLLRLTKMEEPNLLVLDIFDKPTLKILSNKVTTILRAKNTIKNPQKRHKKMFYCLNSRSSVSDVNWLKKKGYFSPRKRHIVIDAGHGGKDSGAQAFGRKEKHLTLDIARSVYTRLKKEGYPVFLTRNTDKYLSVLDRFQLAQQLKADLFVSIHVNAISGVERASGVEVHFLDGSPFFGRRKKSIFLFNKKEDKPLIKAANRLLYEKIATSKMLSNEIQKSVINRLRREKFNVVDRGIKPTVFRTSLRSEAISSIVEVGFLTNKRESAKLGQSSYRNLLAEGICRGIKNFLRL